MLFHLLWRRELAVDLSVPLHPDTVVVAAAAGAMSAATAAVLRPGDWVHFDGGEHQVVALAGTSVRLRSVDGAEQVVLAGHLMASPGFEVIDSEPAPAVEPFGLLDSLPGDGARRGPGVGAARGRGRDRVAAGR